MGVVRKVSLENFKHVLFCAHLGVKRSGADLKMKDGYDKVRGAGYGYNGGVDMIGTWEGEGDVECNTELKS